MVGVGEVVVFEGGDPVCVGCVAEECFDASSAQMFMVDPDQVGDGWEGLGGDGGLAFGEQVWSCRQRRGDDRYPHG